MKTDRVCPVCKGPVTSWLGFRAGMIYKCKNCDYRGPVTLDIISRKDKKH